MEIFEIGDLKFEPYLLTFILTIVLKFGKGMYGDEYLFLRFQMPFDLVSMIIVEKFGKYLDGEYLFLRFEIFRHLASTFPFRRAKKFEDKL